MTDYSPDARAALMEEVEKQGGAHLPDKCAPEKIVFTTPPYKIPKRFNARTCACGNETLTVSVYDPGDAPSERGSGFVRSCAVCDDTGMWPRYLKAVVAADPEMNPIKHDENEGDSNGG